MMRSWQRCRLLLPRVVGHRPWATTTHKSTLSFSSSAWKRHLALSAPAAHPSTSAKILQVNETEEFETLVQQFSKAKPPNGGPVILDCYADWCQPCKQLTPKLEKLVQDAAPKNLRLAKLNVDLLPELAQALRITSLPTVMLVHDGKLVDSFKGGLPDEKLKQFIDKAVELAGNSDSDDAKLLDDAMALLGAGNVPEATQIFAELTQVKEHAAPATAGLALCALGDDPPNSSLAHDLVATLHKKFPQQLDNEFVRQAISRVALADIVGTGDENEIARLHTQLEMDPMAHDARFELATSLLSQGDEEGAVAELLFILKKNRGWNDGAAKTTVLQIFESLGSSHEVTVSGRRRLANILLL